MYGLTLPNDLFLFLLDLAIRGRQVKVLCWCDECNECHGQLGDSSYQCLEQDGSVAQDEGDGTGEVNIYIRIYIVFVFEIFVR